MNILALQHLQRIRHIQVRTKRLIGGALLGAYRSAFKGHGMEFADVREFISGDEPRHIDWNVTARTNQPHVKTFQEERALTILLVVDVSSSVLFGSGSRDKRSLIAEISAMLAFSAMETQDRIGLLLFSGDVEKYIPPGRGERHTLRIVREILLARAKQPGTDLPQALRFLERLQKRSAICFLISDFLIEPCPHALKLAAKRYTCIAIRVTDPRELAIPEKGLLAFHDLETAQDVLFDSSSKTLQKQFEQKTQAQREAQRALFARLDIGLIDLYTNVPYIPAIQQFLRTQAEHRK